MVSGPIMVIVTLPQYVVYTGTDASGLTIQQMSAEGCVARYTAVVEMSRPLRVAARYAARTNSLIRRAALGPRELFFGGG
jgi:hypothetical protein